MTDYKITNTASISKSYAADNGKRMNFDPGETKHLSTLPPEADESGEASGWKIERNHESKAEETSDNGGES